MRRPTWRTSEITIEQQMAKKRCSIGVVLELVAGWILFWVGQRVWVAEVE
jgi:hypothetical protein